MRSCGHARLIAADELRQDVRADGDAGAQTQNPERIPVAHLLFHIVKERDNVAGIAIERACRLGGRDRAPVRSNSRTP